MITYSSGDFVFVDESTYQPFTKPNTTLDNVHRESNYPPTTIKNILKEVAGPQPSPELEDVRMSLVQWCPSAFHLNRKMYEQSSTLWCTLKVSSQKTRFVG